MIRIVSSSVRLERRSHRLARYFKKFLLQQNLAACELLDREEDDFLLLDERLKFQKKYRRPKHFHKKLLRRMAFSSSILNTQSFSNSIQSQLQEILDQHIAGTRHQIKMQEDGLLNCGHSNIQVTWMDAKLGEEIFNSRHGLPVEINALWYNALCIFEKLSKGSDKPADKKHGELARRVRKNFQIVFWNDQQYLNNLVLEDQADNAIRPNQIFVLSLPFRLLSLEKEKKF